MKQQYKMLSCFEQVALWQQNAALLAQVDALLLMVEANNHAIGDNVHDQISDYWNKEEAEQVHQEQNQTEDDYVYLFVIVSFVSFILGFVASYYHYV